MESQLVQRVVEYYAEMYASELYNELIDTMDVEHIKRIIATLGLEVKGNDVDRIIDLVLQPDAVVNPAQRQLIDKIVEIYDSDNEDRATKIIQEYQIALQNSPSFYKLVAEGMEELEIVDFQGVLDNRDLLDEYLQGKRFDLLLAHELGRKGNYEHLIISIGSVRSLDYSKALLNMYESAKKRTGAKILSIKLKR